ncbi:MAG TPA: hypothetical protein VJS64_05865 [Pyrinomonadaceae bacterium]|nr:hypothetical protein [Pyrinomonadaceae bacterium]
MPIVKKRNEQTESRLLLEGNKPIELPPATIDESSVLVQFPQYREFIPELLEELRDGTLAEPVPVMNDGATFAIHADTRTFWVKLWHAAGSDLTQIDRAQVISCIPLTRGIQVVVENFADANLLDQSELVEIEEENEDH